jgi:hypothetical protein
MRGLCPSAGLAHGLVNTVVCFWQRSVLILIRVHLKWSLLRYCSTLLTCTSHASKLLSSRCLSNSVLLTIQLVFFAAINGSIIAVAPHDVAPLKPEIQFVQALRIRGNSHG